mmetsp:Transcript_22082/g.40580  ORF Transcript_22082/g.40580 Transcript_22082/m.40580 type:complete len:101 (+) Transcript_22082:2374-2676(+)
MQEAHALTIVAIPSSTLPRQHCVCLEASFNTAEVHLAPRECICSISWIVSIHELMMKTHSLSAVEDLLHKFELIATAQTGEADGTARDGERANTQHVDDS